jgi:hypothetical protein
MSAIFTDPFTYWIGIDTDAKVTPAELDEFNRFYDDVHVPEVLDANPGVTGVTRFELDRPDPRGDFGPRWLAAYHLNGSDAVDGYLRRNGPDATDRPAYTAGPGPWATMTPRWRMIWERKVVLDANGQSNDQPKTVMFIGMNPMADASQPQVEEFNTFYNETHLDEVLEWGRFDCATRFELHTGLLHPGDGPPRYCATYEIAGANPWEEGGAGRSAEFSSGPPAWEGRDTLWRLVYRLR